MKGSEEGELELEVVVVVVVVVVVKEVTSGPKRRVFHPLGLRKVP